MITLFELAQSVDGTLIGIDRAAAERIAIADATPLDQAAPGTLTLLDCARNTAKLAASTAVAAIVHERDVEAILLASKDSSLALVAVSDPHLAFERVLDRLRPLRPAPAAGIHPTAVIASDARLGRDVCIGPHASIGSGCVVGERTVLHAGVRLMNDCTVGRDCELFPNATLYHKTRIDDRVTIHAGAVIGGYGFGYRQADGRHYRTAQHGWVHVEADCEIGSNSTIDRGTYGATRVATGTKIDNLVQIGHNVQVGPHNLICSQSGIAGSALTGRHVVLGGQVGVRDHIRIGEGSTVGAQAGVTRDLEPGGTYVGSPATHHKEALQSLLSLQKLPEMRKQLRALQAAVDRLVAAQETHGQHRKAA